MSGGCMFCFKQKTVYELRISDWSSDVCSSDLAEAPERGFARAGGEVPSVASRPLTPAPATPDAAFAEALEELRDCRVCAAHLPLGPRPVARVSPTARILIVGQADRKSTRLNSSH